MQQDGVRPLQELRVQLPQTEATVRPASRLLAQTYKLKGCSIQIYSNKSGHQVIRGQSGPTPCKDSLCMPNKLKPELLADLGY